MVEVFGESSTGKTQLAMQAAMSAASLGYTSVFVDTEATFRPERLARMADLRGIDPEIVLARVFCIRAETTERQLESISFMERDRKLSNCKMVIIDTVSKNFNVEYGGERNTPLRQSRLGMYLSNLARDACVNGRAVLLTNRVASITSSSGGNEFDIGGETLRRVMSKVVHLRRQGSYVLAVSLSGASEGSSVKCVLTERGFE